MNKKTLTTIISDDEIELTLEEICHTIHVDKDTIYELIEYEVITPSGNTPENYIFDATCLSRAKKAISFHRDLEVNYPGIALALQLIERIEALENQLKQFK